MDLAFENRFWVQILGDHMRFIEKALHVRETELLGRTKILKEELDSLLTKARNNRLVIENILPVVESVKELKLDILNRQIAGKVEIDLPPTFLNHMVNEIECYQKILLHPEVKSHILEDHYLWQADAVGHAVALLQTLDPTEKKLMKDIRKLKKKFHANFNATTEYIGYLRTGIQEFPAIDKLNEESMAEFILFMKVLETLREERINLKVLGSLNALLADHMLRESAYFFSKLSELTGQVFNFSVKPDSPRVEV